MRTEPTAVRVVLAEDGVLLREGLAGLLARFGFEVAAAVDDAEALLAAVAEHRPDLVVTDIRMPPDFSDEGLRAAVRLRRADPGLAVVALSQYVELSYAADLLDSGDGRRVGYLLKDRVVDVADFVAALRQVADGGTVVDPKVIRQLIGRRRDPLAALSPREHEVLALIAEGHSNAAIARRLVVTDATVGKHVRSILAKLDLPQTDDTHRRVLAVLAYLRGRPATERPDDSAGPG
ncbi:response regulator transcription factor [Actinomadura sp. WMMA1423]|uniref:response regulator n=1 Tax=Actinomadura sp. WMMA1423 TaxID=2591108 RepID=UPI001147A25C|nr:response regulator transcription factor [Actinomadura sp. WMMA1423]